MRKRNAILKKERGREINIAVVRKGLESWCSNAHALTGTKPQVTGTELNGKREETKLQCIHEG